MSSKDVSGRLSLIRDFGKAKRNIAVVEVVAQNEIRKVVRYALTCRNWCHFRSAAGNVDGA